MTPNKNCSRSEDKETMSYYDFDDHFWAPHEVCAQAPKKEMTHRPFSWVKQWIQAVFPQLNRKFN